MPSLQQLNEAIASYRSDHPDVLMTVVVDATFGHRIDPKEVPEFEKAIDSNEFVAPPAGAVGRGDGFILNIAQKANASIISNDSYQEFHGEFTWLFDEGRLIGGKPVPHVGWVWVNRVPVRGPISRRSVKEGKSVEKSPGRRRGPKPASDAAVIGSASANAPMPIPKAPPPGAVLPTSKAARDEATDQQHKGDRNDRSRGDRNRNDGNRNDSNRNDSNRNDSNRNDSQKGDSQTGGDQRKDEQSRAAAKTTNDLLAFLSFVEHFPVGTAVTGVVESYSSHGAYVAIGDVHGYVPLRLMADPAPRSAREAMDLGETVTLVVSSFGAARRSIDLAVPSMAPVTAPPIAKARRGKAAKAAPTPQAQVIAEAIAATDPFDPFDVFGDDAVSPAAGVGSVVDEASDSAVSTKRSKAAKATKAAKSTKPAKAAKSSKATAKAAKPSKAAKPGRSAASTEGSGTEPDRIDPSPTSAAPPAPVTPPAKKARGRSAKSAAPSVDITSAPPVDIVPVAPEAPLVAPAPVAKKSGGGRAKKAAAPTGAAAAVAVAKRPAASRRRSAEPTGETS